MAKQKKERKLTEKEALRVERLNARTAELESEGYVRKDQIISILFAKIMAFALSIPFIVIFGWWFEIRNGLHFEMTFTESIAFLVLILVMVVVHELLHGLTWGLTAPNGFKSIAFGFMKENLTPYCTCGEPLTKGAYILGAFMPCLVLGIIPAVAAVFANSTLWLLIGLLMIMGAGGDLTIIIKLLTYRTDAKDVIILDHPSECGFIVFEK